MRLLLTTDTVGGVWRFAVTLCQSLAQRDVEIALTTFGPLPTRDQRRELANLPHVELCTCACALEWMNSPWDDVHRSVDWLRGVLDSFQPDVLHANMYAPLLEAWPCPTVLTAHSDVCTWWRAVHGVAAPERYDEYRRVVRTALERADLVTTPTRAYGRAVQREFALRRAPEVIHNGIHLNAARAAPKRGNDPPLVMMAGRLWDEAKNVKVAVEAARGIEAKFIVVGDGAPAAARDWPDQVALTGPLPHDHVQSLLAAADVFVSPALYEPFGLAVLEAATHGCALALSDIETFRELWDGAAMFAAANDPESIRAAIQELMSDSTRRRHLASKAALRAESFAADVMAEMYFGRYRALAAPAFAHGDNTCAS